jgi:hypothetical protein
MSKFVKLTPRLLKKIIAEEKLKIRKEQLAEAKKARAKKKKKLKISKKKLLELALIHKRQKQAAAKFKRLHEQKEKIKNSLRK